MHGAALPLPLNTEDHILHVCIAKGVVKSLFYEVIEKAVAQGTQQLKQDMLPQAGRILDTVEYLTYGMLACYIFSYHHSET